MADIITGVTSVFTSVLSWFTEALGTVGEVFYINGTGLTFVGVITLISVGIGLATLLIATIRSLLKMRG